MGEEEIKSGHKMQKLKSGMTIRFAKYDLLVSLLSFMAMV